MKNPFDTPILVIAFNRPAKLEVLLRRLKELGCKNLYFAVDGPRLSRLNDEFAVDSVKKVIASEFNPPPERVLFQETNLGAKVAPPLGISWFFEQVAEGVILEDDCIPGDSFFPFMAWALETYRDVDPVMLISGFNRFDSLPWDESFHFIKTAMIWGWGTWSRAWRHYDPNFDKWSVPAVRRSFRAWAGSFPVFDFWRESIRLVSSGASWNWDIAWCWALFSRHGLCVMPRVSLIQNIGFGSDSTNTITGEDGDSRFQIRPRELREPFMAPRSLEPDLGLQRRFDKAEFWRADDTLASRIKRLIKRLL